jgi:hypothetical protein
MCWKLRGKRSKHLWALRMNWILLVAELSTTSKHQTSYTHDICTHSGFRDALHRFAIWLISDLCLIIFWLIVLSTTKINIVISDLKHQAFRSTDRPILKVTAKQKLWKNCNIQFSSFAVRGKRSEPVAVDRRQCFGLNPNNEADQHPDERFSMTQENQASFEPRQTYLDRFGWVT